MAAAVATVTQTQEQQLTSMFSMMSQANQTLREEQNRTTLAAQRSFDQITETIQTLTVENGALRAKLIETDARIDQQKASFDEQLNALKEIIQVQNQTVQALTNRTTTVESTLSWMVPSLNKATNCAAACRGYILAIYSTLWRTGQQPNIPNP